MKFEVTTDRGEIVKLTVYRAGDATLTIHQAGDWRTAFMSAEQVGQLLAFLDEWREPSPFTYETEFSGADKFCMSWETAPMVPTVFRGES